MSEKEIPGHRIDKLEAETLIGLREGKDKKSKVLPWLGKRSNGEAREKVKANRRSKYEEGGKRRKQNERERPTFWVINFAIRYYESQPSQIQVKNKRY